MTTTILEARLDFAKKDGASYFKRKLCINLQDFENKMTILSQIAKISLFTNQLMLPSNFTKLNSMKLFISIFFGYSGFTNNEKMKNDLFLSVLD